MPKFSIIVPVYNVEREYLEAALNSVLAQTFSDWECICVDDGSTNDSGKVLDEFAVKDSRFKVHHRTNQGVSATRNTALDLATGEWITFLDGDDLFAPNRLDVCCALSSRYPQCKIIHNRVDSFSNAPSWTPHIPCASNDVVVDLSCGIPFGIVAAWEFSFHHSLCRSIRFPSFKNGEDGIFVYECIMHQPIYLFTPKVLYGYRQRATSATHTLSSDIIRDGFLSIVYRLKLYKDDPRTLGIYTLPSAIVEITHNYVVKIVRDVPPAKRQPLWDAWFDSLEFLSSRKEYHLAYRWMFKICKATHSRTISYLLSGIGLAIAWRLKIPFAYPLSPKAWAEEASRVIDLDGISASVPKASRYKAEAPALPQLD